MHIHGTARALQSHSVCTVRGVCASKLYQNKKTYVLNRDFVIDHINQDFVIDHSVFRLCLNSGCHIKVPHKSIQIVIIK